MKKLLFITVVAMLAMVACNDNPNEPIPDDPVTPGDSIVDPPMPTDTIADVYFFGRVKVNGSWCPTYWKNDVSTFFEPDPSNYSSEFRCAADINGQLYIGGNFVHTK